MMLTVLERGKTGAGAGEAGRSRKLMFILRLLQSLLLQLVHLLQVILK